MAATPKDKYNPKLIASPEVPGDAPPDLGPEVPVLGEELELLLLLDDPFTPPFPLLLLLLSTKFRISTQSYPKMSGGGNSHLVDETEAVGGVPGVVGVG